jgi:hypothetical protein
MSLTSDLIVAIRDYEVDENYLDDDALTRYIQRSYTRLYNSIVPQYPKRFEVSGSLSITAGDVDGVSLPSDFWSMTQVEVADSRSPTGYSDIRRVNRNNRNDHHPLQVSDIRDLEYDVRANKLFVYPPSESVSIRIWYVPVEPADPSTVIQTIPNHFEYLLWDVIVQHHIGTEEQFGAFKAVKSEAEMIMRMALDVPYDNASSMRMNSRKEYRHQDRIYRNGRY